MRYAAASCLSTKLTIFEATPFARSTAHDAQPGGVRAARRRSTLGPSQGNARERTKGAASKMVSFVERTRCSGATSFFLFSRRLPPTLASLSMVPPSLRTDRPTTPAPLPQTTKNHEILAFRVSGDTSEVESSPSGNSGDNSEVEDGRMRAKVDKLATLEMRLAVLSVVFADVGVAPMMRIILNTFRGRSDFIPAAVFDSFDDLFLRNMDEADASAHFDVAVGLTLCAKHDIKTVLCVCSTEPQRCGRQRHRCGL